LIRSSTFSRSSPRGGGLITASHDQKLPIGPERNFARRRPNA
jgi:hypothetical protein